MESCPICNHTTLFPYIKFNGGLNLNQQNSLVICSTFFKNKIESIGYRAFFLLQVRFRKDYVWYPILSDKQKTIPQDVKMKYEIIVLIICFLIRKRKQWGHRTSFIATQKKVSSQHILLKKILYLRYLLLYLRYLPLCEKAIISSLKMNLFDINLYKLLQIDKPYSKRSGKY